MFRILNLNNMKKRWMEDYHKRYVDSDSCKNFIQKFENIFVKIVNRRRSMLHKINKQGCPWQAIYVITLQSKWPPLSLKRERIEIIQRNASFLQVFMKKGKPLLREMWSDTICTNTHYLVDPQTLVMWWQIVVKVQRNVHYLSFRKWKKSR